MSTPRIERGDRDEWLVTLTEGAEPFRVVDWRPPRMLLARGDEVRAFFCSIDRESAVLAENGHHYTISLKSDRGRAADATVAAGHSDLSSPMPGKVLQVLVAEGDTVEEGDRLLIVEAMKMETPIRAPRTSQVTKLHVQAGDSVAPGETLVELDEV